eukprot:4640486-Amphidinium_carterae.1
MFVVVACRCHFLQPRYPSGTLQGRGSLHNPRRIVTHGSGTLVTQWQRTYNKRFRRSLCCNSERKS